MKKLFKKIDASLYDVMGKISHTKINSYIILTGIYISSLIYLVIDIMNAVVTWSDGETYEIPGTHIGIFALLLGHHLALLGIKKNSENRAIKSPNTNTDSHLDKDVDKDVSGGSEEDMI